MGESTKRFGAKHRWKKSHRYSAMGPFSLIKKLEMFGFVEKIRNWFYSFLTNRSQRVKIGKSISDKVDIQLDVPQGGILSPLLYIIYISDFEDWLVHSKLFSEKCFHRWKQVLRLKKVQINKNYPNLKSFIAFLCKKVFLPMKAWFSGTKTLNQHSGANLNNCVFAKLCIKLIPFFIIFHHAQKDSEKAYFDRCFWWALPKLWSKYTTPLHMTHSCLNSNLVVGCHLWIET